MKNAKLSPCYSIQMRDYIASHGIRYELVGLNPETKNMCWVYIKNERLKNALEEWSKK